jgi:putative pyruvate formate lyase activating enzyme
MLSLQEQGCHNINLVSPSHVVPQIIEALVEAVSSGLHIPLVYNTSSYDNLETVKMLEGIVDIYLPDIKYSDDALSLKYSEAPDYVSRSRSAIKEMYRQVGDLVTDDNGVALRGMIVRHLILPGRIAGSKESLEWLAREVSNAVTVSIMAQYHPAYRAGEFPELARGISRREYDEVVNLVEELGLENGWVQELSSAHYYLPDFEREGHPFQAGR